MIPLFKVFMDDKSINNCVSTLKSGMITQSTIVEQFEYKLKQYFNNSYVLTLNSGTSALTLALKICNLSETDEVLTSPLTCFATTSAILANGYNIKWVDIDDKNCNMSLDDLEEKINKHTKVILYVLWGGTPLDLERLYTIKTKAEAKYGTEIIIIQDCAHAFGNKYNKEYPTISCYSFQAIKHLTTGDGGAISLPNEEMYNRCKRLRWYGIDRTPAMLKDRIEQDIVESGYKFHMNDINASIGLGNLENAIINIDKHRNNALFYYNNLQDIRGIKLLPFNSNSSYWIYTILTDDISSFSKYMNNKQIQVNKVHTRNDTHSCVKKFYIDLPTLNKLEYNIISIPCGWWLTEYDLLYIKEAIIEWSELTFNGFVIRRLLYSDKEQYISLLSHINNYQYTDNSFANIYTDKHNYIYVVQQGETIVSTAKFYLEEKLGDNIAHIEDVVTLPDKRKQGYGSMLLKFMLDKIKTMNVYKIILQTNIPEFYELNGFKREGYNMTYRMNK